MIVPMKKISLIIRDEKKNDVLKTLRKLGIVHIEITEGSGEQLSILQEQISLLENALYIIGKVKNIEQKKLSVSQALSVAERISFIEKEKKEYQFERNSLITELDRLRSWGDIELNGIKDLEDKGFKVSFYEMPKKEYEALGENVTTLKLDQSKSTVRFMLFDNKSKADESNSSSLSSCRLVLPKLSTEEMKRKLFELDNRIKAIDEEISSKACYVDSINQAVSSIINDIEFETYSTGMENEKLSVESDKTVSIAYFKGFIEADNVERLRKTAKENSWGLVIEDPTEEDNAPTKLKNNKFVSLIYPLTDFLGTVPGYFEYDISAWFLVFILIFFGIIFGDGGYGLIICAVVGIPIIKSLISKKKVSPTMLLIGLFGLSTILWGTVTCTWFGLSPEQLPEWLTKLSIPIISNVYEDKIWYPFWTDGAVGLTTSQNLQIFCFTLALVQLTVAHIKGALRNKRSIKMLGDFGSILQLFGIYYLVLSLVVNPEVFSFGLVIGSVPVGTVAIALIGIGFVLNFVFANYEGNIGKSVVASFKDIVSVLLGVVNVFSDIVSYIRLWAVGLAGAAISATVNELAGPFFGNFLFMIIAIILLVFGHGLNMILNVLSVIVHGIRLNTLEFSSHLNMSWSGHKFKPFKEQID